MTLYITDGQIKRFEHIDSLLVDYVEHDIPDEIIDKIHKKFSSTKHDRFIRTEEIEKGMMIRYVDLHIEKISPWGIVTFINKELGEITTVRLYNPRVVHFWKITPDNHYIFEVDRSRNAKNRMVREYCDMMINKEKNE